MVNGRDAAAHESLRGDRDGHYLDVLTDALMVRQLPPRFANVKKRQVKAPKIHLRDSGLLHRLLGIDTEAALLTHPRISASARRQA